MNPSTFVLLTPVAPLTCVPVPSERRSKKYPMELNNTLSQLCDFFVLGQSLDVQHGSPYGAVRAAARSRTGSSRFSPSVRGQARVFLEPQGARSRGFHWSCGRRAPASHASASPGAELSIRALQSPYGVSAVRRFCRGTLLPWLISIPLECLLAKSEIRPR